MGQWLRTQSKTRQNLGTSGLKVEHFQWVTCNIEKTTHFKGLQGYKGRFLRFAKKIAGAKCCSKEKNNNSMIPSGERILHNIFQSFGQLTSYSKVVWKGYVTSSSQEGNSLLLSCLIVLCSCVFYDSCLIFPLFASLLNDNSTINSEVPTRNRDSRSRVLHSKLYGKNILVTVLSPSESLN